MKQTFTALLAILVVAAIFSFSANNCYSQDVEKAKNIIYLDFGILFSGKDVAIGTGISYERMLGDNISIRAGVNIGYLEFHFDRSSTTNSGIGLPITINYMTNNKNKFEAGIGGGPYLSFSESNISLLPAIRLGYRYQPDESGMMYRLGVELPANTYISFGGVGYHF